MLDKLVSLIPEKSRDVTMAVGGMAALVAGRKIVALSMFAKGLHGLEMSWRERNNFSGTLSERWQKAIEFYESTHTDPTNRKLHAIGIPMIVGGAAGLLFFPSYRPMWLASAATFAAGWVLNILGHARYEQNAPAFSEDPLSFLAGPVWDLKQLRKRKDVVIPVEKAGANGTVAHA